MSYIGLSNVIGITQAEAVLTIELQRPSAATP